MNLPTLAPEHVRILKQFAQDTGAFRVNKDGATELAAACAAALQMAAAIAALQDGAQ